MGRAWEYRRRRQPLHHIVSDHSPAWSHSSETHADRRRACGPLQDALQYANFSTSTDIGAYDYCADWADSTFVEGCQNCLRSSAQEYLANMVSMLQVGCDQKPQPGSTISIDGAIFSTTLMNETSPTPTSTWTNFNSAGPISLGAKVGIAIGALCLALAVAGFCIVCNGRRRRRAFLRKLEMRHKESGWPHPFAGGASGMVVHRGPDMNETPLSQKPLRGWDDSPQSATASEPSYARYFSPYSSQHNSPVNGTTAMMQHQQWPPAFHDENGSESPAQQQHGGYPSSAQEKAIQDQHEAATGAAAPGPPAPIGLALGGDEPSLRSKVSNQSVPGGVDNGNGHDPQESGEAYELYEVSSSAGGSSAGGANSTAAGHANSFRNRIARENRAPVLQHPGYGRYSPDRALPPPPAAVHAMSGGLEGASDGVGRI